MYCKNCGAEIPEGKKFCGDCGTAVEEKAKSKKGIVIIGICLAVAIVACAVIFGMKLAGGNNNEENTTANDATVATTEAVVTDAVANVTDEEKTTEEDTTEEDITEEITTKAQANKKPETTKKKTEVSTTKKKNPSTASGEFVVGKKYKSLPLSIKTKEIRIASWRGYIINLSEDIEVLVKYDKDYNFDVLSIIIHKPSLNTGSAKSVDITYLNNGKRLVTIENLLGLKKTYTEDEIAEGMGASGYALIETMELIPTLIMGDPMEYLNGYINGAKEEYVYIGKETLKTGEAHAFSMDSPSTGEKVYCSVDAKTGMVAHLKIEYKGVMTDYYVAEEIKA